MCIRLLCFWFGYFRRLRDESGVYGPDRDLILRPCLQNVNAFTLGVLIIKANYSAIIGMALDHRIADYSYAVLSEHALKIPGTDIRVVGYPLKKLRHYSILASVVIRNIFFISASLLTTVRDYFYIVLTTCCPAAFSASRPEVVFPRC
jgi:hypothetical protein